MDTTATTPLDLREALYIYALDVGRFDTVRRLLDAGFSPRPNLALRADLTPCGQRAYDHLAALIAPADDDSAPIVVSRRAKRAQHRNYIDLARPRSAVTPKVAL